MMLKFRAFHKPNKKMYDVLTLDIIDKKALIENLDEPEYPLRGYVKYKNIKLMQSTGLKDKNGVEIYEGDILLNTASENQEDWKKWRVHYADGRFLIDYKQIPKDKRKRKNLELEDLCEDNVWIYGLEVIGNIYENPELLEVE